MEKGYVDYLFSYMIKRGLTEDMVRGLIREVGRIAMDYCYVSLNMVNERLQYLGWGKDVLDEKGLQLILAILEDKGVIQVHWQTPH